MTVQCEFEALERQIFELTGKLPSVAENFVGDDVKNYPFITLPGATSLYHLFAGRNQLLMINNIVE